MCCIKTCLLESDIQAWKKRVFDDSTILEMQRISIKEMHSVPEEQERNMTIDCFEQDVEIEDWIDSRFWRPTVNKHKMWYKIYFSINY